MTTNSNIYGHGEPCDGDMNAEGDEVNTDVGAPLWDLILPEGAGAYPRRNRVDWLSQQFAATLKNAQE